MIKTIISIVILMTIYSVFLKGYLNQSSSSEKESAVKSIEPSDDIMKKHNYDEELGPEVSDLVRYRYEMLEKVNEINSLVSNPQKMLQLKKIVSENKGFARIQTLIKDDSKYQKIKAFIQNYGTQNMRFLEPDKVLTKKESQFFEVVQSMTLKEYKEKFDLDW